MIFLPALVLALVPVTQAIDFSLEDSDERSELQIRIMREVGQSLEQTFKELSKFDLINIKAGSSKFVRSDKTMARPEQPEPRVSLDFSNMELKDALKKIFEQVNQEFNFDLDQRSNKKITLCTSPVKFSTALDLVSELGGIAWRKELRISPKDQKQHVVYRFRPNLGQESMTIVTSDRSNTHNGYSVVSGSGNRTMIVGDELSHLIRIVIPEERAVFNCPHCHEKVVAFKPNKQKGESSTSLSQWKFCPLCGKPISFKSK